MRVYTRVKDNNTILYIPSSIPIAIIIICTCTVAARYIYTIYMHIILLWYNGIYGHCTVTHEPNTIIPIANIAASVYKFIIYIYKYINMLYYAYIIFSACRRETYDTCSTVCTYL